MKEIQNIIKRLKKFYQSLAQVINHGGVVVLNRFDAETALMLIKQLNTNVKAYSTSCSIMLDDIQFAQKVYKEEMNDNEDGKKISKADAKGMLGCYISYMLKGSSHKELRNYADNAIKLAEHVTHTKTDDEASMESLVTAVIALVSVVNIIYHI